MELKITFDVSEKFATILAGISTAILYKKIEPELSRAEKAPTETPKAASECGFECAAHDCAPNEEESSESEKAASECGSECAAHDCVPNDEEPSESEKAPSVDGCAVPMPEPFQECREDAKHNTDEKHAEEKPAKRSRQGKKPKSDNTPSETQKAASESDFEEKACDCTPNDEKPSESEKAAHVDEEASKPEPENSEAPADDDPYCGMTLLQAVQKVLDEVRTAGLELSDVNSRIRKAAEEYKLSYPSAACLMKAVGYKETKRIVFGE